MPVAQTVDTSILPWNNLCSLTIKAPKGPKFGSRGLWNLCPNGMILTCGHNLEDSESSYLGNFTIGGAPTEIIVKPGGESSSFPSVKVTGNNKFFISPEWEKQVDRGKSIRQAL